MDQLFWRILISILTSGAVVAAIVGLIFGIKSLNLARVKAWIAVNEESWRVLKNLAYDVVVAAQQMFDNNGEKKAYVMKFLADHLKMSEADLLAALEQAVKLAKKEFGEQWNKLPVLSAVGFQPSL